MVVDKKRGNLSEQKQKSRTELDNDSSSKLRNGYTGNPSPVTLVLSKACCRVYSYPLKTNF